MFDQDDETSTSSYWPSVADLFMTLFIITIAILAVVFFLSIKAGVAPSGESTGVLYANFGVVREQTNRLREEILGLDRADEGRSTDVIVRILQETCDDVISKTQELIKDVERLKKLVPNPEEIGKLLDEISELNSELTKLKKQLEEHQLPPEEDPKGRRKDIELENEQLKEQLEQFKEQLEELRRDSPTIIVGENRREFRFSSGSPLLSDDFSHALRNRIRKDNGGFYEPPFQEIANEVIRREGHVNTLEIIGHTDGVPLSASGNLDQRLPEYLAGERGVSSRLAAGSNNDLGLLRALAIKQEWLIFVDQYEPEEHRDILRRIDIRSYSAGQTILPVQVNRPTPADFRKNDPQARRIEMRLTRLSENPVSD